MAKVIEISVVLHQADTIWIINFHYFFVYSLGYLKQPISNLIRQISEIGDMLFWTYQNVSGVDR